MGGARFKYQKIILSFPSSFPGKGPTGWCAQCDSQGSTGLHPGYAEFTTFTRYSTGSTAVALTESPETSPCYSAPLLARLPMSSSKHLHSWTLSFRDQ